MSNYRQINWDWINKQIKLAKEEYWGCFDFGNYTLTEIPNEIFERMF